LYDYFISISGEGMFDFIQNPYFWAGVSLLGLLGANTSVNTRFGKKYRLLGLISRMLFNIGRIIMVLPFVSQPRINESNLLIITGILVGIVSAIFIIPRWINPFINDPIENLGFKTNGLYSIVRHPFYLGEILFSLALAIYFHSIIGIAFTPIWWAGLQLHIINEEESLEKEFGPFYLEYKKRVKRRIIPFPPFNFNPTISVYPFKNLVFKGGGMKGSAYTGALEVLEEKGLLAQIERVAGSSAGAITATLVSFNLPFSETLELIESLDFKLVPQQHSENRDYEKEWLPKFIGKEITKISGDVEVFQRLMSKYGWYSTEYFNKWMRGVIAKNCNGNADATFADFRKLGFKDLFIVSANVSKLEIAIFSADNTPDFRVADAVRMSMSIPLYFEVMRFDGKVIGAGDYYVDGGILMNYPLHIFDQPKFQENNIWYENGINWETLGFYLFTNAELISETKKIENFKDFISHLYEAYNISIQMAEFSHNPIDQKRSVKINTLGISSTDFHLTKNDQKFLDLVDEGRKATLDYLENYHRYIIKK
jgi:NTE family protein